MAQIYVLLVSMPELLRRAQPHVRWPPNVESRFFCSFLLISYQIERKSYTTKRNRVNRKFFLCEIEPFRIERFMIRHSTASNFRSPAERNRIRTDLVGGFVRFSLPQQNRTRCCQNLNGLITMKCLFQ